MAEDTETIVRRETGARLRGAREWAGLEQRTVAEHLGVHADTLRSWESGRRRAPLEKIEAIADYTRVPMWFFRGGWDGWRNEPREDGTAAAEALERIEATLGRLGYVRGPAVDPLATEIGRDLDADAELRGQPSRGARRTRRADPG